jgi:PncC family amidohydrolase
MQDLLPLAEKLGSRLKARGETVSVAESSAGGLISAALLSVPGASAYYLGGAVVYTRQSRELLLGIAPSALEGMRPSTEPYALLLARTVRGKFSASWGIGETGATGPTGNRYGDAAGHACIAVVGTSERVVTEETGIADRISNMRAFARAALVLLAERLG